MRININKYWIGFLTGIIIIINIFSTGVILCYTLSLNLDLFFVIWLITTPILLIINYLRNKQIKEIKEKEEK